MQHCSTTILNVSQTAAEAESNKVKSWCIARCAFCLLIDPVITLFDARCSVMRITYRCDWDNHNIQPLSTTWGGEKINHTTSQI